MTASDFRDFVERKANPAGGIDWDAKRDIFLERIESLNDRVISYLAEYTKQNLITVTSSPIALHEEHIGSYSANQLKIEIGTSLVTLKPIGTLLVGSPGRVDLEGPKATAKLVLAPSDAEEPRFQVVEHGQEKSEISTEEIEWDWKIVTYSPRMHYITLTEQSFRDALMAVADA